MIRRLFFMFIIALLLSAPALAAENEPPLPKPIQKLRDDGAQLRYLGRDLGFDAWLAVENGQEQYFYVTPDGSAFFLGVMFNKNGRAITFDQMVRLKGKNDPILADLDNAPSQRVEMLPATTPSASTQDPAKQPVPKVDGKSRAEQLFHDVAEADWFVMGAPKAPVIYMFIDPMCPHCKDFLTDLKPLVDGNKLQIRLIPVGMLTAESRNLAAGLLAARGDAGARLYQFMAGDTTAIASAEATAQMARVDANNGLMAKWNFQGTPMTIYRAKDGKVKLLQGRADRVDTLTKDLP